MTQHVAVDRSAPEDRSARARIVEPIAKSAGPGWPGWADTVRAAGGREDEWRFPIELPGITGRLGRAARLDHRELTARSLYLGSR